MSTVRVAGKTLTWQRPWFGCNPAREQRGSEQVVAPGRDLYEMRGPRAAPGPGCSAAGVAPRILFFYLST